MAAGISGTIATQDEIQMGKGPFGTRKVFLEMKWQCSLGVCLARFGRVPACMELLAAGGDHGAVTGLASPLRRKEAVESKQ